MTSHAQTGAGASGEPEAFLLERILATGISERQIASALRYHRTVEGRQPISRTLVELGLATDDSMARWIADSQGWRYLPREELRVEGDAHRLAGGEDEQPAPLAPRHRPADGDRAL